MRSEHVLAGQYGTGRYRDYYVRGQIIRTNTYVDVRAITKMMPLNSSSAISRPILRGHLDRRPILTRVGVSVRSESALRGEARVRTMRQDFSGWE